MRKLIACLISVVSVAVFVVACGGGGGSNSSSNGGSTSNLSAEKFTPMLIQNANQARDYYAELANALVIASTSVNTFCNNKSDSHFNTLQQNWKNVLDHYAAVELLRFGPIRQPSAGQQVDRSLRFQAWPANGTNTKAETAVATMITGESTAISQTDFVSRPTQFQSIEAIEYLLFDEGDRDKACFEQSPGVDECDQVRSCEYLQAAVDSLKNLADDVSQTWTTSYATALANAGKGSTEFSDQQTAITALYTAIADQLRRIRDKKLRDPLNLSTPSQGSPKKLEAWRSRQSLLMIKKNLQTLRALYTGGAGSGADDILKSTGKGTVDSQFKDIITQSIADVDIILSGSANEQTLYDILSPANPDKSKVNALYQNITELVNQLEGAVQSALQVSQTFNEDDGD